MSRAPLADRRAILGTWLIFGVTAVASTDLRGDTFIRGDANRDQKINLTDGLYSLNFLFLGGEKPPCLDAVDANDDGVIDITDPIATLTYLFITGVHLPPPNVNAGNDPTPDTLGCVSAGEILPPFERILMECMDAVSIGGTLEAVARTQEEYEQLILERFQQPLDDYSNANYDRVKQGVLDRNPGIDDEECEQRVREIFYSVYPFRGTEDCTFPEIDFETFTLLGQDANATGCGDPDYEIEILRDDERRTVTFRLGITEHGSCEIAINRNQWVLVPKIPPPYTVLFEKEYTRL